MFPKWGLYFDQHQIGGNYEVSSASNGSPTYTYAQTTHMRQNASEAFALRSVVHAISVFIHDVKRLAYLVLIKV